MRINFILNLMRTTIDLDDDILAHARELAQTERASLGKTISRYLRERFQAQTTQALPDADQYGYIYRNGIPVYPPRGKKLTQAHIVRIADEQGV